MTSPNKDIVAIADRRSDKPAEKNEVQVLRGLMRKKVIIKITTIDDEMHAGPIHWSDLNNIALKIDGNSVVFVKRNILFWEYDPTTIE